MADTDALWTTIAAERGALADDLASLTDEDWEQPSLCEGWSVRDLLAHMSGTAQMTPAGFFVQLAKHRGFNRMLEAKIRQNRGANGAEALAIFRSLQDSRGCPPGPKVSWLGETIVHAEDIRRPLGIPHAYPADALVQLADFYSGSNALIGSKRRIAGVRIIAKDADWTRGDGPEVTGSMRDILMAMTGRRSYLDELSGEGVAVLRAH